MGREGKHLIYIFTDKRMEIEKKESIEYKHNRLIKLFIDSQRSSLLLVYFFCWHRTAGSLARYVFACCFQFALRRLNSQAGNL